MCYFQKHFWGQDGEDISLAFAYLPVVLVNLLNWFVYQQTFCMLLSLIFPMEQIIFWLFSLNDWFTYVTVIWLINRVLFLSEFTWISAISVVSHVQCSSCLYQDSYGYMVAFAGRKYAARSNPPAFVANSSYTITSFTLVRRSIFHSLVGFFFSSKQRPIKSCDAGARF